MHSSFGNPSAVATEIDGQFRPGKDKIVRRKFGAVAKVLWPGSTDAHVAAIAKVDVRTARRWLSGEFEPPLAIALAVLDETFRLQE
jgi:hypothetical protein